MHINFLTIIPVENAVVSERTVTELILNLMVKQKVLMNTAMGG